MRYHSIDQHRKEWRLSFACEALAVSVSGYYRWHRRPPSAGTAAILVRATSLKERGDLIPLTEPDVRRLLI